MWYLSKVKENSPDSIHQILAFGTLNDIRALKSKVGEGKMKELFLLYPKKIYNRPALNFIKNFILHISGSVDDGKYLKNTLRNTR